MPTVFSHALTGLAIATVIRAPGSLGRLGAAGALAAVVPDLDVVVSPISPSRFFTQRGLDIMRAEVLLLWLPTAALAIVGAVVRGQRRGRA